MNDLNKLFKKFGRSVYATSGDWSSEVYSALIQPLRYKNKMYVEGVHSEIGQIAENFYLYLGPADKDFRTMGACPVLHTADGKKYEVHKSEKIFTSEKAWYIWAVIREII